MDSEILFPLVSIFLLVVVSAFFSGAETGLIGASKARIHKLKSSGNKRARIASLLRKDKDSLIGTVLLGNNAVNILASAIATKLAINMYGDGGVIYATIAMTALILIFAEVMPKTYAVHNAEKVSLFVAPLFMILTKILSPVTRVVQFAVDAFLTIFGVNKKSSSMSSKDELRGAIDLQHYEGVMLKAERDMLESVLDLPNMEVQEIMVHRKKISSVNIDQPSGKIITEVLDSEYTRVPVWKGKPENIVGILHVKALLKELRTYHGEVDNIDIMKIATQPWFVPETNSLSNQLIQFREKKNHIALVVDEYGALAGLVTLEDIIEEIVGQIDDEHDIAVQGIKKLKSGAYRIKGDVTIRDINRELDWKLPEDIAATIAGLLIHNIEDIPNAGQKFRFYGFSFEISRKRDNQITSVLVRRLKKIIKN